MTERALTPQQKDLLEEIYCHQVYFGGTSEDFRTLFYQAVHLERRWTFGETHDLAEKGLVKISHNGPRTINIIITNSGRKYIERVLN